MKILKGFLIAILSFILFLAISIFSTAYMLNNTLLEPQFMASEIQKLDTAAMAKDILSQSLPSGTEGEYIKTALNDTLNELKPWLNEQIKIAIYSTYDYFLGKSQTFQINIPTEQVKQSLVNNLKKAVAQSPPPQIQQIPAAQRDQVINQMVQQYSGMIPAKIEFNAGTMSAKDRSTLEEVRKYIAYYQMGYIYLIIFIVILIAAIILLYYDVRKAARSLGTNFLTFGIIGIAGYYLSKYVPWNQMMPGDVPSSLQTWMTQFLDDLFAPLQLFSIITIVIGVVLLVISFVYRRSTPKAEAPVP